MGYKRYYINSTLATRWRQKFSDFTIVLRDFSLISISSKKKFMGLELRDFCRMETLVIDNIFSHLVVPNVLKNIYEHILARHLSNVIFVWRVLRRNIIYFDTEIFILWRRNILVKYVSNILLIRHNIKDIKQPILQNTIRLQKVRIFPKSSTPQKDRKSSTCNFISSWDAWDCRPFRTQSKLTTLGRKARNSGYEPGPVSLVIPDWIR